MRLCLITGICFDTQKAFVYLNNLYVFVNNTKNYFLFMNDRYLSKVFRLGENKKLLLYMENNVYFIYNVIKTLFEFSM